MSHDNIPPKDTDFDTLAKAVHTWVNAHGAANGLTAQQIADFNTAYAPWSVNYLDFLAKENAFHVATTQKTKAREIAEPGLRTMFRVLTASHVLDATLRATWQMAAAAVGKTVVAAPTTRPVLKTESKSPLAVLIAYADETTPASHGKPAGAANGQLYYHVGDTAPADPSGYAHLATITRSPYHDTHAPADGGKTVWYIMRWANDKGQTGPWSVPVSAHIPA